MAGRPKLSRRGSASVALAVPAVRGALVRTQDTRPAPQRVLESWLKNRKATTLAAYKRDLAQFADYLGVAGAVEAIEELLRSHGRANELVTDFVDHLREEGYATSTIERYCASLRSAVKVANLLDVVHWRIDARTPVATKFTDTEGPALPEVEKALAYLDREAAAGTPAAVRNRALIYTALGTAARRSEMCGLDVGHVERDGLRLLGKGQHERELMPAPPATMEAIGAWLVVRKQVAAPQEKALFVAVAGTGVGTRLTASGIYDVCIGLAPVMGYSKEEQYKARPHAWRHAAITQVAKSKGLLAASAFARHSDTSMTMHYVDNIKDQQVAGAAAVGQMLVKRTP